MQHLASEWNKVRDSLKDKVNKRPDLNAVLFLIGIREMGFAVREFTKEEKQDLMNIALCRVLSVSGYFRLTGKDKDDWPVWEQDKPFPKLKVKEQEAFIKEHVIQYFYDEQLIK